MAWKIVNESGFIRKTIAELKLNERRSKQVRASEAIPRFC